MNSSRSYSKKIHNFKLVAMILLAMLAVIFFLILAMNPALRGMISVNPLLLSICAITWGSLLISFFMLTIDFYIIKKHHDIARELDEYSFLDSLTGLPNRYSIDRISEKYSSPDKMHSLGCVLFVISNLKELNEKLGRDMGDKAISDFCEILESIGRHYGLIGRNSGNEFIVIMENCDKTSIEMFIGDFQRRIHNHNTLAPNLPLQTIYTSVISDDIGADNFYSLITGVYREFTRAPQMLG